MKRANSKTTRGQRDSGMRQEDQRRADDRPIGLSGLRPLLDDWNNFWFSAGPAAAVNELRVGVCVCAAIWWLTFFVSTEAWFGSEGILPVALTGKLIEFEETARWQHWSPLWWTDSLLLIRGYLAVGVLLSLIAATGMGGRAVIALLWLVIIGWVHRIAWLQGSFEPALIALLGYFVVSPGTPYWGSNRPRDSEHWLHNVALRLIQVHVWGLLAAGVLSQLGNVVWWRGESLWWLAASGRSQLLTLDWLGSSASLVNGLTHAMLLVQLLTLGLLLKSSTRGLGLVTGLFSVLAIGLFADQTLYAVLLAISLLAFRATAPLGPHINPRSVPEAS